MDVKNIVTNVIAFFLAVGEPVKAYFLEQEFNWATFIPMFLTALIAWFTGKDKNLKAKK